MTSYRLTEFLLIGIICDLLKCEIHFSTCVPLVWTKFHVVITIVQRTVSTGLTLSLKIANSVSLSDLPFRIGKDFEDDLEFLLQGVSDFDLRGGLIASEVLVHGPLAFPIGTTANGRAFLAGAYYGQGRVVVISHEGLLQREVESKLLNCLK